MEDNSKQDENQLDEKAFEELLENAKEEVVVNFYKETLTNASGEILNLRKQISKLQSEKIVLRDEVALQCYPIFISENPDYTLAAKDAYNAADAFIRARETGL